MAFWPEPPGSQSVCGDILSSLGYYHSKIHPIKLRARQPRNQPLPMELILFVMGIEGEVEASNRRKELLGLFGVDRSTEFSPGRKWGGMRINW